MVYNRNLCQFQVEPAADILRWSQCVAFRHISSSGKTSPHIMPWNAISGIHKGSECSSEWNNKVSIEIAANIVRWNQYVAFRHISSSGKTSLHIMTWNAISGIHKGNECSSKWNNKVSTLYWSNLNSAKFVLRGRGCYSRSYQSPRYRKPILHSWTLVA